MKGLWHMDRLEFEVALQYLTHPSLIPTFADEILEVLVRQAKHNDLTLPLAYYHTVQPALTSSQAVESLFSAISRTNVTEAFYFSRAQQPYAQRRMFEMMISLVLKNSPKDTIADRSVELVNLPFSAEEEGWFEEYLLHGQGRSIRNANDTVMMRRVGTSNFNGSLDLKHRGGRAIDGLDWTKLSEAIQDGVGPRLV
ncbi:nuclear pore complex assembly-domain-containing protein [Bisporella sp. PMI_857]|nr:nuclear pore complex assembly-domain-containing protein [Bisporella sp. PMI_857]